MKEAIRQLAGLERRKRALGMLADAIEVGLERRLAAKEEGLDGSEGDKSMDGHKRKREGSEEETDRLVKKERTDKKF